ncbi:MAG: S-layer homology domain-containing protein, partial [Oscillospiraceae bacterium]|nr:S-layer homology domain-containing protein [Oscillospiraceae bacterium]
PNVICTRAQAVCFLHRLEGSEKVSAENIFTDVKEGTYYYDAVLWAVKNEITNGTSATTFSPDMVCTRGQIVTLIYRDMAK